MFVFGDFLYGLFPCLLYLTGVLTVNKFLVRVPIVGPSVSCKPFGTSLFLMYRERKSLREKYLPDFSFSLFRLIANPSLLRF